MTAPEGAVGHRPGAPVAELNARIDRLPTWGLSWVVFLVLGLSYFFVYYDITAIGVSLPSMLANLRLPESASGPPITYNLLAYIVGSYALGSMADYIGRRRTLVISVMIITVGSLLTAFSWNLVSLTLFRALTGIGMGAQIALAATFLGEYSNAKSRGRFLALNTVWGALGFVVSPFIGLGLLPLPSVGWRILVGIGALAVVLLFFCRDRWLPESPRWLVLHGHAEAAERTVARMERNAERRSGRPLPPPAVIPAEEPLTGFPTAHLLSRKYLPRLAVVFFFWAMFYMWIYGYLGYQPTLLTKLGIALPSGLLYTGIGFLGFLAGGLLAPVLIDHLERKVLVGLGIVVAIGGFVLLALGTGPASIIVGELLVGFGNFAAVTAAYAYTAEVFPTRARASAMSIGDGLGHIGGAVAPYIVLALLSVTSARAVFGAFAVMALISLLIILGAVRATKRGLTELSG
ncbi:MAG: MFS transporter [Sciscionella sp.]